MALYRTAAVVLGAKNWGEADKMMTFFTRERGLVQAAAFGAGRAVHWPPACRCSHNWRFSCLRESAWIRYGSVHSGIITANLAKILR